MQTLTFTRDKWTAGTARYMEDGPRDKHVLGNIYVRKSSEYAKSERIRITIESADEK